jgi:hypothetical protein
VPTLAQFLRSTPSSALQSYFATRSADLPQDLPWDDPPHVLLAALIQAVDALDRGTSDQVLADAERIGALSDEAGETALYSVTRHRSHLNKLENSHARAVWMFLNDPVGFGHAEEIRFADDKRHGRQWDGFILPPGCVVARNGAQHAAFEQAIADQFDSRYVKVELCDRARASLNGNDKRLVQVVVYREGRSGDLHQFVDGKLARRNHRPVIEAALTYESDSGTVEVVASAKETREQLVRMFATHLLGSLFFGEHLPMRHYSLQPLRQAFSFPTDPEDGIEAVRVTQLRLMPYGSQGERITLECQRRSEQTIWKLAEERLNQRNGLADYRLVQAQFSITFRGGPGRRGGRILPVRISIPKGCDLKDRTQHERLVGEKYLKRWGLLQEG